MADLGGQTLGKYQVIEKLGRGGMAEVYRGFQPGLEREVAIKVMHPHLAEDEHFITRFQREAKAVARLRHAAIVQVIDFDVQDGSYYMVMEYIPGGRTLKENLIDLNRQKKTLPLDVTLDIMAQLADALDYAHREGMIHRDVKPANVLMRDLAHPLLSDFGIARLVDQTGLTSSGVMIGTPAYMAPEQGKGEQADARSDIYALGVMLYEMLTGRPPYEADTPYGVILKHIGDPLPSPRQSVPALPDAIEKIVFKSLAKDPSDRYQQAGALRDALMQARQALADGTVAAQVTPPPAARLTPAADGLETLAIGTAQAGESTSASLVRRRSGIGRWVLGLGGLLGLLLIAAVVIIVLLSGGDDEDTGAAPGDSVPEIGASAGEQVSANPEVEALIADGFHLLDQGDLEGAQEHFDQALEIEPENSYALAARGTIAIFRGEPDQANEDLGYALSVNKDLILAHFGFALLYLNAENYYDPDAAFDSASAAIDNCDQIVEVCIQALQLRGDLNDWYYQNLEASIVDYSHALELAQDSSLRASLLNNRALKYWYAGDLAHAYEDINLSYEAGQYYELLLEGARIALYERDYDMARAFVQRAMDDHGELPNLIADMAYINYEMGDGEAALLLSTRAFEMNPDHPKTRYMAALMAIEAGQTDRARELLEPLIDLEEPWLYSSPFISVEFGHTPYLDLAQAAYVDGDYEAAYELIDEALSVDDWWPWPYFLRAQLQIEQGELALARENLNLAEERIPEHAPKAREILAHLRELAGG